MSLSFNLTRLNLDIRSVCFSLSTYCKRRVVDLTFWNSVIIYIVINFRNTPWKQWTIKFKKLFLKRLESSNSQFNTVFIIFVIKIVPCKILRNHSPVASQARFYFFFLFLQLFCLNIHIFLLNLMPKRA